MIIGMDLPLGEEGEMKLQDINQVFSDMKAGKLDGRMVMTSF